MIKAYNHRTALARRLVRSDQGFRVDLERTRRVRRHVGARQVVEDCSLRAEQQAAYLAPRLKMRFGNDRIQRCA